MRYAYALEFLIACMASQVLWAEIGGTGHLDLIPWYYKLVLIPGLALTAVLATAAAVESDRPWNGRVLAWGSAAILVAAGMAVATYYAHVHESDEPGPGGDPSPLAAVHIPFPTAQGGGIFR